MLPLPKLSQSSEALTAGRKGKGENSNNWIFAPFPTPNSFVRGNRTQFSLYLNISNDGQSSESLMRGDKPALCDVFSV